MYAPSIQVDPRTQVAIPTSGPPTTSVSGTSTPPSVRTFATAPPPELTSSSPIGSSSQIPGGIDPIGTILGDETASDGERSAGSSTIGVGAAGAAGAGGLLVAGLLGNRAEFRKGSTSIGRSIAADDNTPASSALTIASGSSARSPAGGSPSREPVSAVGRDVTPEPGGMLQPGAGVVPRTNTRGNRRRRLRDGDVWPMPATVASLLIAHDEAPIYHEPGPGVIGIDR
jgi:hypothetical protein